MGFPFKYQDEMYTCGVACLQMLSECFQLRISANEIKKLCNLNPMAAIQVSISMLVAGVALLNLKRTYMFLAISKLRFI